MKQREIQTNFLTHFNTFHRVLKRNSKNYNQNGVLSPSKGACQTLAKTEKGEDCFSFSILGILHGSLRNSTSAQSNFALRIDVVICSYLLT